MARTPAMTDDDMKALRAMQSEVTVPAMTDDDMKALRAMQSEVTVPAMTDDDMKALRAMQSEVTDAPWSRTLVSGSGEAMADDLSDVQAELGAVRKALREGSAYLGMTGDSLQKYFLQLNQKENIMLSKRLQSEQSPQAVATNGSLHSPSPGGYAAPSGAVSLQLHQASARPAPDAVRALNRESIPAVLEHLTIYEGSASECAKALRALSSLAYANAQEVGRHAQVLPQVLRVCDLHPSDDAVWLPSMRSLCNLAYDHDVVLGNFGIPVLHKLICALSKSSMNEIGSKAGEAIARVMSAEVSPDVVAKSVCGRDGLSPMVSLIVAATDVEPQAQPAVVQLLQKLVTNEVVDLPFVADRCVAAARICIKVGGLSTARWLQLAKRLAEEGHELGAALVKCNAIPAAADAMSAHVGHELCQLSGIEALSTLVGNRWNALQDFADVRGIAMIEVAMRSHAGDAMIQTKSIRALSSGVAWPEEIRSKSGYSYAASVELTKAAMKRHASVEDLQKAGMEALSKYVDTPECVEYIRADAGEELIQSAMTAHGGNAMIQTWGNYVKKALRNRS